MSTSTNTFIINANVYSGSFVKSDGSTRSMRFIKENAVPQALRGVFDLDKNGWRVFNHDTVVETPSHSREEVTIEG